MWTLDIYNYNISFILVDTCSDFWKWRANYISCQTSGQAYKFPIEPRSPHIFQLIILAETCSYSGMECFSLFCLAYISLVFFPFRAHDYFQRFHSWNMKGGPEGEGSWTVIHKYSSQCVLALYVKLIPLQVVYYYHLFVSIVYLYLVNSSGTY